MLFFIVFWPVAVFRQHLKLSCEAVKLSVYQFDCSTQD